MKILYFGGGLGNQIFEYAFYQSLKDRYPNDAIYGVYEKKRFMEHEGGFEIEKIFDVQFPRHTWIASVIMFFIMVWNKFIHSTSLYCHNLTTPNYDSILFNAHKMNKMFYENRTDWIKFKQISLSSKNKEILEMLKRDNYVSIHVRRGDFLSAKYIDKHAGVATLDYYSQAIQLIKNEIINPKFIVFSDDIRWCKENLAIDNAIFCDWNTGRNSYLDMYLMTFTKANIIANSTFSYWGAYLNPNVQMVIYPEKWKYSESQDLLDIFPNNWIGI